MSQYIKPPAALHEKGSRGYNQDYILPELGTANQDSQIFIVCDLKNQFGFGSQTKRNF